MDKFDLIYSYCKMNERLLEKYKTCICLFCGQKFDFKQIKEFVNDINGRTAVCPCCNVDAVVPIKVHNGIDNFEVTKEIQQNIKSKFL